MDELCAVATDEDFDGPLIQRLRSRLPKLDLVRVVDQIAGAPDAEVLQWCAAADRVLLTHDVNTLLGLAHRMASAGQAQPGVIAITQTNARTIPGVVVDDLVLVLSAMTREELARQVVLFVPLSG